MTSFPLADSSDVAQTVYIARQPIFDMGNRRVAYELLYRANARATNAGSVSQDVMCSDTALHAVVSIGLDRLTSGAVAFVNVTRDHLLAELYRIFDPSTVVLELLESIDGDSAVEDACQRAVASGYTLALDDYDGRASLDTLLPLVKIVKLDVLGRAESDLRAAIDRLKVFPLTILAERVETGAMRALCQQLGCALFQGYVFSRPETLSGRAITVQQTTMINIMGLLGDATISDSTLEDAFSSHPSLSFALLRIVNSASFGARNVESIPHAIRLIGREALSRWLMVMFVASIAASGPLANEVVTQSMVRGRFCELLSLHTGSGDPAARFLVGLLSCIDVLLGQPMEQVLNRLPVSADVRDALLHEVGPHSASLSLVRAYESGDWERVAASDEPQVEQGMLLAALYGEASAWAAERLAASVRV
jgi:EAL and modified HD-GYP domain-containing signal transduction protein